MTMRKLYFLALAASCLFFSTRSLAGVTLTSSAVAASNIAQGSNNNIVYIVKMDVSSLPVVVNSIQYTLTGTHDNNDLTTIGIYFNASSPSLTGAVQQASASALFAGPHAYNTNFNFTGSLNIAAGSSGYFIIAVNVNAGATAGNTVKVDGAANPISFGYTTSPTITDNQTDIAGIQTIQAAAITLTSSAVTASNIAPGTNNNIVYIVKTDVSLLPVVVNSIQYTLTGTHDNNDLTTIGIFFNASSPSLSGAVQQASASALFAGPHAYNTNFNFTGSLNIAAGSSGYFIIAVNVNAGATISNTVKVDGAANPVSFGYTTSPTITDNQTDIAATQTISNALPLTLMSFTGNIVNGRNLQLQWITAGELNTKDFEVGWSGDGQQFINIAVLPAAGNSSQNITYSYLHKTPLNGNNYYRLKMIDQDGMFTYSPVIKINIAVAASAIIVFPNPVIDFLHLQVQAEKNETIVFRLHDEDGKIIASKLFALTKGNNQLTWSIQQFAAGNYFISSGNTRFETIRIIKN
jgi:hypothetical protein